MSAQEPCHETIAGAEHVVHLDGKPGPTTHALASSGMAGKAAAPIGPRFTTIRAGVIDRIFRSAAVVSVVPPAM